MDCCSTTWVTNCGSDDNGPQRVTYLSNCSPVGGTVLEGLEGVNLLEKVYHWDEI